jgi:hypothetical protein
MDSNSPHDKFEIHAAMGLKIRKIFGVGISLEIITFSMKSITSINLLLRK